MMLKKQILSLVLLMILVLIAGCGQANRYRDFSKEERMLSWSGERKRSFGDADYTTIESETEALDLLKNKYNVAIPKYYEKTKKMFLEKIPSEAGQNGKARYAIFARNKELEFRTLYPVYKGKELTVFSEQILTYVYSVDTEQAYLKSQVVTVKIAPVNGTLPNDNTNELIKIMGKNMNLLEKQITAGLAGYEKRIKATQNPIQDEHFPIISNINRFDTNQEFLKEIAVVYDEAGIFRELYAEISDQKK